MIYVITPIYNTLDYVKTLVRCLNNQTEDYIFVAVDDGCTDGSVQWIAKNTPSFIVRGSGKLFFGGSVRKAYKAIRRIVKPSDTVLIINADRTLCNSCFLGCPQLSKRYLEIGQMYVKEGQMAVSGGYSNVDGEQVDGGMFVDWSKFSFRLSTHPNIAGTSGLFMSGKDFIGSGGFSRLLPHYWSDVEFIHRQMGRGIKLIAPEHLNMFVCTEKTGIHSPDNLKELFDIRCSQNPIYKSIFVLKRSPLKYIPINLLRAWYWVIRVITKPKEKEIIPEHSEYDKYL